MVNEWERFLANGIKVSAGDPVPQRKEIRDLIEPEMYLFLEGLARFQHTPDDKDDPKSWFQIAGIHGLPYQTWPNLSWNKDIPRKTSNDTFYGFCTHSSILFLTWHRPYLALFEAILFDHVKAIANGISDSVSEKKDYLNAAKTFRLPYWDWARKGVKSYFPEAALHKINFPKGPSSSESWFVKNPNEPKYNPLFQAPFPSGVADQRITMNFPTTVRYPRHSKPEDDLETAVKDFYEEQEDFRGGIANLSERVSYTLLSYSRFRPMSNNRYSSGSQNQETTNKAEIWGSFEDIHNAVHGLTGGGGHMNDPAKSAFDPIFWLHHANIDRLFAIWQALHGDSKNSDAWITKQQAGMGDWSVPFGAAEDMKTPLYPFRPTKDTWYDSTNAGSPTSVQRTESFGYTYPETANLSYPVPQADINQLHDKISSYYTNFPKMLRQSKAGDPNAGDQLLQQSALLKEIKTKETTASHSEMLKLTSQLPQPEVLLQQSLGPEKPFLKDLAPDNTYLEWLVNIKAQRHSLGGKYSVHVFLGPVEEDNVRLWPLSPHYVGSFVPFGQAAETPCGNCQDQQQDQVEVTSQIPLTIALVERYLAQMIGGLSPEYVVPYLTENLHWRVEVDGAVLENRAQVDGLTVFVISNEVTLPADENQLPIYADGVTIHPEVTTNLNGEGRGDGTGLTAGQQ